MTRTSTLTCGCEGRFVGRWPGGFKLLGGNRLSGFRRSSPKLVFGTVTYKSGGDLVFLWTDFGAIVV